VTVYIDGNAGIPQYLLGDEFNVILAATRDPGKYILIPNSAQGIPIAAVFLLTGTERIGWGEIYDLRQPEVPVPATGSALQVYDTHVSEGQFGGIDFLEQLDVQKTGTTAYVNVAPPVTGSFVVFDEGNLLGSALGLNVVGAQGQIVISGAYAHLMLTGTSGASVTGSITVYDEGVLLGQADAINVVGDEVQAVMSGTTAYFMHSGIYMAPVTGSIMIADEDALLGSVLGFNFDGDNVQVVVSGSWAHVMITGTAGGGGSGSVIIQDEGVLLGSADNLDFIGAGVETTVAGDIASITIPGVTGSQRTWGGWSIHYTFRTGTYDSGEMTFDSYSGTMVTTISCHGTDADGGSATARVQDMGATVGLRVMVWSEADPDTWWAGEVKGFSAINGNRILTVEYIKHNGGDQPFEESESVVLTAGFQPDPTGTVVVYEESTFLGNFKELRFIGAGVTALNSGSYAAISIPGGGGGGTGSSTFINLDDTPASYSGQSGTHVVVKSDESGLEFIQYAPGALIQYVFLTGTTDIGKTTASWEAMDEMIWTGTFSGGPVEIVFSAGVGYSVNQGDGLYRITIDGNEVGGVAYLRTPIASAGPAMHLQAMQVLSAGQHVIAGEWWDQSGGTLHNRAASQIEHRSIVIKEFASL
ncbi:hypothetical protein LCGC14_1499940, partial [marine sediment metagenome]